MKKLFLLPVITLGLGVTSAGVLNIEDVENYVAQQQHLTVEQMRDIEGGAFRTGGVADVMRDARDSNNKD